ncbi:MAG: hypothetical protein ABI221_01595 [Candidatus Saccharimonadales bacterium]
MNWLFLAVIIFTILFGVVVLVGAPYLPTLRPQTIAALELLNLRPGQTLLELGSGDGRVMRAAAARGLTVVGYELNPLLVLVSLAVTWRYRRQVRVVWGNFWRADWPETDGIFVFLLDKYMQKLDKKVIQKQRRQNKPIKLVSFSFKIPGRTIDSQQSGLFLYRYY